MKFCSQCGSKLSQDASFCAECGMKAVPVQSSIPPDEGIHPEQPQPEPHPAFQSQPPIQPQLQPNQQQHKGRGKLLAIILGSIAAVLIILGVGGYLYGAHVFNAHRTIDQFQQALKDQDVNTLMDLLQPSVSDMNFDKENVKKFAAYLNNHASRMNDILKSLRSQADKGWEDPSAVLQLKKDGKQFLLYDHYTIEIAPYYLTVQANFPDAVLQLNGVEFAKTTEYTFSQEYPDPLIPGDYEVSAIYQGEITEIRGSQNVELFNTTINFVTVSIDASYVSIYADENAELFINSESMGTVGDLNYRIGPITFDGQFTLHAERDFPWGRYQSDPIVLTNEYKNNSIDITFPESEEMALDQVMDTMNEFYTSWVGAFSERDIRFLTNVTEERKSSFATDVQFMRDYGQRFTGDLMGSLYNLDSFYVYEGYSGSQAEAYIQAAFSLADAAVWYEDDGDPQLEDTVVVYNCSLIYDKARDKWLVSGFYPIDTMDTANVQEYTFQ